jgi:6-phosphogluconolactonase
MPPTAPSVQEHHHQPADTLWPALAAHIGTALEAAMARRGQATLAVSGGRSPVPLFEALRQLPLAWARVQVLPVDERCVPPLHPDSNAALVRRHLLQEHAIGARFVPLFDQLPDAPEALNTRDLDELARAASRRVAPLLPADVVVLGLGEDGHTASLFPGAAGTAQALATAEPVAWTRPTQAPHARLTLSLAALRGAGLLELPLCGPVKQSVYRQSLQGEASAERPLSLLLTGAAARPAPPLHVWLAP